MPRKVALGGPEEVVDLVRASGRLPGPTSYWVGAWVLKSGWGGLQAFLKRCAARGDTPLILFWWWGDDISPTAIRAGVMDKHQGVRKDRAQALDAARKVSQYAKDAGGEPPIIVVENEFNKAGCEASDVFASYFTEAAAALRTARRDARVCFAPGSWGDLTRLAAFYREQIEDCDYLGLQALASFPRMSVQAYRDEVPDLERSFGRLRAPGGRLGSMDAIVYDAGFSSYGGKASTAHPFAGGDGRALEAEQAAAWKALAAAAPSMNIEAVVARDLDDNPSFALSNHFGHGERWWGVRRADGSHKPALDQMLSVGSPNGDAQGAAVALHASRLEASNLRASLEAKEAWIRRVRDAAAQPS